MLPAQQSSRLHIRDIYLYTQLVQKEWCRFLNTCHSPMLCSHLQNSQKVMNNRVNHLNKKLVEQITNTNQAKWCGESVPTVLRTGGICTV